MADHRPLLDEATVAHDPIAQFGEWYERALETEKPLPHAVALATASRSGHVSARMVLLKGFDARGFVFFTNYRSRKGEELRRNASATLLFYWGSLSRQVRVELFVVLHEVPVDGAVHVLSPRDRRAARVAGPAAPTPDSRGRPSG